MAARVLVTPRSLSANPPRSLGALRERGVDVVLGPPGRQPNRAELAELLPGVVAWIAGVEVIDDAVLDLAPDLRLISRNGAGTDSIDQQAAVRHGVAIVAAPGANASGVAELAVGLMISALRSIAASSEALRHGRWERELGRELGASSVGVIGMGAIGVRVASLVAAFGASVVGSDPFPKPEVAKHYPLASIDDLLGVSDIVTVHTPGLSDGSHLLNRGRIERMQDGTVLINTARSQVVDEDAVLAALESGHLAAYAVDAFAQEPPMPSPLLRHPKVIATPHLGAFTRESSERASEVAVAHVIAFLDQFMPTR